MEHGGGVWGHAEGPLTKSCGAGWPCVGGWGAGRRLLEATLGRLVPVSPLEKYLQRMVLSFVLEAAVVEVMLAVVGGVDLMAAEGVCWGAALHLLGTHCDSHCDVLRSCLLMHFQGQSPPAQRWDR